MSLFILNFRKCKLISSDTTQISILWGQYEGQGELREGITRGHKKTLRGDGYVDLLITMIISWVYTCTKTFQVVYLKYIQFILCQLHIKKAAVKNHINIKMKSIFSHKKRFL